MDEVWNVFIHILVLIIQFCMILEVIYEYLLWKNRNWLEERKNYNVMYFFIVIHCSFLQKQSLSTYMVQVRLLEDFWVICVNLFSFDFEVSAVLKKDNLCLWVEMCFSSSLPLFLWLKEKHFLNIFQLNEMKICGIQLCQINFEIMVARIIQDFVCW